MKRVFRYVAHLIQQSDVCFPPCFAAVTCVFGLQIEGRGRRRNAALATAAVARGCGIERINPQRRRRRGKAWVQSCNVGTPGTLRPLLRNLSKSRKALIRVSASARCTSSSCCTLADRSDDAMTPAVGTKNFSQSCCTSQRCSHTHSTRAAARAGQLWRALESTSG